MIIQFKKLEELRKMKRISETCGTPSNMNISSATPRRTGEKGAKRLFGEIMGKNSPDLIKTFNLQVQGAGQISNRIKSKRLTPRYIIINMLKNKEF